MSLKFEIADWRFEVTLKELICSPNKTKTFKARNNTAAGRKPATNNNIQKRKKSYELDYTTRRQIG